jgi:hypothetical protein
VEEVLMLGLLPWEFWLAASWIAIVVFMLRFVFNAKRQRLVAHAMPYDGPSATVIAFPTPASRGLWLDENDLPEFRPIVNGVENGWVS